MIYGINFRPKQPDTDSMGFPPGYAKKFRKTMRLAALLEDGTTKVVTFRLVGICESLEDAKLAHQQADNGHRKIYVVRRKTARGPLFGIFVY